MKALTVKQPWASLIASGIKQVENRTYPVPKTVRGQRVAIHAGKGFDPDGLEAHLHNECRCDGYLECDACRILYYLDEHQHESKKVAGRILCTARIVGQYVNGYYPEWFIDTPCWACDGNGSVGGPGVCDDCEGTGQHFETNWMFFEASSYCRSCSGVGEHLHCGVTGQGSITCTSCQGSGQTKTIYNWILADVELVDDPRIHRGMLGLWEVKPLCSSPSSCLVY